MIRVFVCCVVLFATPVLWAQSFPAGSRLLFKKSCIHCHDASTDTRLNLDALDGDLKNPKTFRQWVRIFDRVERGEMPPKSEARPDSVIRQRALKSLKLQLRKANLATQKVDGRVAARRLTRLEYEYTLQDLLGVGGDLATHLPPENESSVFDTVAASQGLSPVHLRSYLRAADVALDEAIQLGRRPSLRPVEIKYRTSHYSTMWVNRPLRRGGSTVKLVDDAWVTFDARPHLSQSNHMGYRPPYPGRYRITAEAYGYQAKTPVTMLLYRSSQRQGGATLIATFDLPPGESRAVEVASYFTPQDFFFPAPADHDWQPDGRNVFAKGLGAKQYKGEGLAIKWLKIEGPLEDHWPPERTRRVFPNMDFVPVPVGGARTTYAIKLTKTPQKHLRDIIEHSVVR